MSGRKKLYFVFGLPLVSTLQNCSLSISFSCDELVLKTFRLLSAVPQTAQLIWKMIYAREHHEFTGNSLPQPVPTDYSNIDFPFS